MRDVAKIRFLSLITGRESLRNARKQEVFYFLLPTSYFLEIFLRPVAYAIERFLDVFDRVGDAEAQIAFAEIAEGGPGQPGDAGVVEQRVRQFLRGPPGLLDVGENVKRAFGQAAGKTFDLVQTSDHHVAPPLKLGAHRISRGLRSAQRFAAGDLSEARGAGIGIRHQPGDMLRQIGAHHAIAHSPAGHGISFGKAIEQNAAIFHAVDRHDGVMLAFEDEAAVDLVAQHHDVAIADRVRDAVNVVLRKHAAGRVMRRIHNDQLRAIVDQSGEFADIEAEIHLLAQPDRNRFRADVINHRLVNRESGIGVDDLIAFFNQREDSEKDDWLTARDNDHFFGSRGYATCLTHVVRDRLAQLRQAGRWSVMRETFVKRVTSRVDDVAWRIKIGFADFEMNDVAALCLQRARFHQDFERCLGPETRHPFGEAKFGGLTHDHEIAIIARWRNYQMPPRSKP